MCGIVGFVSKRNNEELLAKMMNSIRHRGPDAEGTYVLDGVHIGSKRLSILDLSENGRMPMYSKDGTIVVAQNGEIYNYPDLKKELESLGHNFFSASDTEVIINGYLQWGMGVFNKLRGMFAVSLLDKKHNKFYLVRDRLGIKPLYFLKHEDNFYYSSEVKAFNQIDTFSMTSSVEAERVRLLLGFMFYPDSAHTIMKNVQKLKAGHYLEINTDDYSGFKEIKYWDLPYNTVSTMPFEEATNKLEEILVETIKGHMLSDVPVCVMLSGGLDSSVVTAIAQKNFGNIHSFSAKFDHPFNESENARQVADYLGTVHNEIFIDIDEVSANIESSVKYFDDLTTFDGGVITTKILCEQIKRQGYTVTLLGEGSDEIFGGYSWFGLSKLPVSLLPNAVKSFLYYYSISRNILHDSSYLYGFFSKLYNELLSTETFAKISELEIKTQLPNHLLMKVDKGAMASSVEARVPFMDHKLVEFVFSLPSSYKLYGSTLNFKKSNEKYILREVAKRYLPEQVVNRKKRGFMLPMREVLEANKQKIKSYILAPDAFSVKFLEKQDLEDIVSLDGPEIIKKQKEYLLWRVYLLELWYNAFKK